MNDTQKLLESVENLIKQGRLHVQYLQGSENLKEAIDICISTKQGTDKNSQKIMNMSDDQAYAIITGDATIDDLLGTT